ncbi:porin family protein [Vibrio sp. SM6]|uniref:Porin family protein n=1 Tax=Vibrio agarilyticus TaxID=2726741 RepID=A0A7X8YH05_9VIBR|nr:porin family protein [Vibrio agarilyticus]NLS12862.1 porin family protein [Vibrio agarilyticus]
MKKWIFLALLSASVSAESEHPYVGANVLLGHNTTLDAGSIDIDENNDVGAGLYAGYEFDVHPNIDLGLEVEYQYFGKAEFAPGVSVDGQAFYVNARPKFTDADNILYSALILGIGGLKGEGHISGLSDSDTEFSYQLGVEMGVMLDAFDFSLGYRYREAGFNGFDAEIQGVTIGLRYHF